MSELLVQILSGVGLFFLGVVIGAAFHRTVQGEASKNKRLEQKLAELQETHSKYQAEVSKHFMNTAEAVNTLNKSYRDVHTQLAKGASRLCNDEHANDFLALNFSQDSFLQNNAEERDIEIKAEDHPAPMDYAPKEDDTETGTLSETYGMEKEESEQSPELTETPPRI